MQARRASGDLGLESIGHGWGLDQRPIDHEREEDQLYLHCVWLSGVGNAMCSELAVGVV